MSKHPNTVLNKTAQELAEMFSKTTYGYQEQFFKSLYEMYQKECLSDLDRGYKSMARLLGEASFHVRGVRFFMVKIWRICEPKMETDKESNEDRI